MKSKYDEEKETIKSTLKNKAKESLAKEIKKTSQKMGTILNFKEFFYESKI